MGHRWMVVDTVRVNVRLGLEMDDEPAAGQCEIPETVEGCALQFGGAPRAWNALSYNAPRGGTCRAYRSLSHL